MSKDYSDVDEKGAQLVWFRGKMVNIMVKINEVDQRRV